MERPALCQQYNCATFKRAQSRLRASLIAQLVKKLPAMQRPRIDSWVGKICWRRDRLPTPVFLDFHCGSAGKESTCNVRDLGSIPVLGRSPGEGNGYRLQYSCLEYSMDRGAWQTTVHGDSQRVRQDWATNTFHFISCHHSRLCRPRSWKRLEPEGRPTFRKTETTEGWERESEYGEEQGLCLGSQRSCC